MRRISIFASVILLAASAITSADAQDVKLYSRDNKPIGVYEQSHALVIGIDDYDAQRDLPKVREDIVLVSDTLRKLGFEVELHDDNPTGRQLREAVDNFIQKYGYDENSRILIWFGGHGVTIDGEGYLLGSDAKPLSEDAKDLNSDLRDFYRASMPLRQFGITLREMRSRHVLLVLDSCFAATIFDTTRSTPRQLRDIEMTNPTRQIITSGGTGQEVLDDGKFAREFVDAITGKASFNNKNADSNGDYYLSGSELGYYLSQAAENPRQKPQYGKLIPNAVTASLNRAPNDIKVGNDNFDKGEFFFVIPDPDGRSAQPRGETEESPAEVVSVVWSKLTTGTSFDVGENPAAVFAAPPPGLGEPRGHLDSGQHFPDAGITALLEQSTIGGEKWLRFKKGDEWLYLREADVKIVEP